MTFCFVLDRMTVCLCLHPVLALQKFTFDNLVLIKKWQSLLWVSQNKHWVSGRGVGCGGFTVWECAKCYIRYTERKNPEDPQIPICRGKQTPPFGNDDCNWMGSGTSIINHPLCVHTAFLRHQTHVPPWSVSHWWVNLGVIALLPWTLASTHTLRHTH